MNQLILVLVVVAGALVALALALVVRRRERVTRWVQALFRRPPKPAQPPGPRHYYKTYWS
jgi:hypothetical protein